MSTNDPAVAPEPYVPPKSIPLPSMTSRSVGRIPHEDATIILALLDLHRTAGDEEGSPYLGAALLLGEDLVEEIRRRRRER
jgi:hypothetical protein